MTEAGPETLVIGLGNPILGDDGVGWRVIDQLECSGLATVSPDVELDRACVGGVALMERLAGHRRAIVVDAFLGSDDAPGSVWCRPLADVVTARASHLDSSHDASLPAALAAGEALGAVLPDEVLVVGIAIERGDVFGEALSGPVAAAVPVAAAAVATALSPARAPRHA